MMFNRATRIAMRSMAGKEKHIFSRAQKDEADVYIYDLIGGGWGGGVTAQDVATILDELDPKTKSLNVRINSAGGDVFEATAILNLLKDFPAQKVVHVDGLAASAASMIAMAGDRILTAKNAMWMIHDPWGFTMGTAADMRRGADMLDKVRDVIVDTYVARTKAAKDDVARWMADETWMTADEAKARGFTEVVEAAEPDEKDEGVEDLAPRNVLALAKYRKTPKDLRSQTAQSKALRDRIQSAEAFVATLEADIRRLGTSPGHKARKSA